MATSRRRTFSGAIGACLLGVSVGLGWVSANPSPASAVDAAPVAAPADACPVGWPALRGGHGGGAFDGHVSVLVGGDLRVGGRASGAEGVVVVRGSVSVSRDQPGPYLVGATGTGSQVTPHPGSDMLVVGGDLVAAPASPVEVAPALDGDAAVGGAVAEGTELSLGGGRLDQGVADVLAPYDGLLTGLAAKSAAYAALPDTGTVEVTDSAIVLVGDGVSTLQVITLDAALLAYDDRDGRDGRDGRALQVQGVPDGTAVVVNLVGPEVALAVDRLTRPDGDDLDPAGDPRFGDLATHLLWNVPTARTVAVSGDAQLPGSLLVGSGASTTTLDGAGTNGRVLVAGDLVHSAGELHSYPFAVDPDLACGPDLAHRGTFTLDVVLDDPTGLVDPDKPFQGTYRCVLDGVDVTPDDGTWRVRATATERVIATGVPVGAVCSVEEQLEPPVESDWVWAWEWAGPDIAPASVTVAKRDPRGFTITNTVRSAPPPGPQEPQEPGQPDQPDDPVVPETDPETPTTQDPTTDEPVEPPPLQPDGDWSDDAQVAETAADLELVRPSETPRDPSGHTGSDAEPGSDADTEVAAAPAPTPDATGPLTTTAPYSLRGTFVWAPLLLLSVLALRLRFPWRYKRRRRLY